MILIGNSKLEWYTAHSKYPGVYITFESCDGAGKDTVAAMLKQDKDLEKVIGQYSGEKILLTREPGGTIPGEMVRETLLNNEYKDCQNAINEALGFAYQRGMHFEKVIIPCLKRGNIIISSRGFDSSIVYQGYARGLDKKFPEYFPKGFVTEINYAATMQIMPDLTILFNVDPQTGLDRIKEKDRIEKEGPDFHKKVEQGYLLRMKNDKSDRKWASVNANLSLEEEYAQAREALKEFFHSLQKPVVKKI